MGPMGHIDPNKRDDSRLGRTHIVRGLAVYNIGTRPRYASQPTFRSVQ